MADKFVVGHKHCEVCGSCLLHGDQLHRCPGVVPIDPQVLALFLAESTKHTARPVHLGDDLFNSESPSANVG